MRDSHPSSLNNVKNPFFFWATHTKILKIIFRALDGEKRGAADKWEDKITENFKIGLKSKRWKFEITCTHTVHLESGKWKWTHSFGKFVNLRVPLLILKCFLVDGFWRKVADFCEICQVSVTCPFTTLTLQLRLARLIEGKSKINKQKIK